MLSEWSMLSLGLYNCRICRLLAWFATFHWLASPSTCVLWSFIFLSFFLKGSTLFSSAFSERQILIPLSALGSQVFGVVLLIRCETYFLCPNITSELFSSPGRGVLKWHSFIHTKASRLLNRISSLPEGIHSNLHFRLERRKLLGMKLYGTKFLIVLIVFFLLRIILLCLLKQSKLNH